MNNERMGNPAQVTEAHVALAEKIICSGESINQWAVDTAQLIADSEAAAVLEAFKEITQQIAEIPPATAALIAERDQLRAEAEKAKGYIALQVARAETAEREVDALTKKQPINTDRRLFDLVRFMRSELHKADLITDEEYSWLCLHKFPGDAKYGSPSRGRLESYDAMRAELAKERARLDWLMGKSFLVMPSATSFSSPMRYAVHVYTPDGDLKKQYPDADSERAAIDAAMKEDV